MLTQAPPMARSGAIPRPGQTAATIAALLLPAVLLAGLRVPSLFEPHGYGDEAIFAAIAHDVLAGQTLYAEAWDNKPPMIFVTYAAIQAAFGAGMFPLHLVATGFVLGAQLAIMATAWRLHGTMRAAIAGCVFALLFGLPILEGNLAFTETFMALPTSLAVLVALLGHERPLGDRLPWYAAAGILLGVAANYKQVAIFDAAALGLMVFAIEDRRLRSAGALALGFALPHVLALVAFAMFAVSNVLSA